MSGAVEREIDGHDWMRDLLQVNLNGLDVIVEHLTANIMSSESY